MTLRVSSPYGIGDSTDSGEGVDDVLHLEDECVAIAAIMGYACSNNLMDVLFPDNASFELSDIVDRLFRQNEIIWADPTKKRCVRHAAGIVDIVIRASCWRRLLIETAYPHQLVVALLYALPARQGSRRDRAESSWDVLLEWLPVEASCTISRHLTMLAITDRLFGIQWRPLRGLECSNWTDLSLAVLSHKPPFLPGVLHGGRLAKELALPHLASA